MKIIFCIHIATLLVFTSCSIPRDLYSSWHRNQTSEGKRILNSSVFISKDSTKGYSIWDYAMDWKNFNNTKYTDRTIYSQVRIEVISENNIKLFQIIDGKEVDSLDFDLANEIEIHNNHKLNISSEIGTSFIVNKRCVISLYGGLKSYRSQLEKVKTNFKPLFGLQIGYGM